ncbi:ATPase, histidine kinase-, DNA gyrase B-, and HSP90-like domain protein [Alloalcanivorax dieselolei B5]|uniref:histidine kinase n=1 Tax=Alcanivorax dieselolei (strain DSM 16502 / CGMCC 1.3690 / MCCC 1A00001 / B-5) TaxID=930169 RepID=K0CIH4_ALCDB|nr:ATP-binding protein [Alloalcanivorax dieselolei]AFT71542.1 ATPase, histidine kinase-, DNA gyrase B-, and HSP90-like domain protein [Alloalcanivorax dieselolei B5]GGJ90056.1 two-component sensor histidine kinase [Alloalcanivorax dieselolei]
MNSIFVRIYGGILVALLIIGAATYVGVDLINQYRADQYRERMAEGTFFLLGEGLREQSGADRAEWLREMSRRLGASLRIHPGADLSLTYRERLHLDEGRVVIREHRESERITVLYHVPGGDDYLVTSLERLSEQQARATAGLILDRLKVVAPEQRAQSLARLVPYFGFPLSLAEWGEVGLDEEQYQRLDRNEMVLLLTDSTRRDATLYLYVPIPRDHRVLVLGPMTLFDPFPWELLVVASLLALCMVALSTYLQVRPLQTRLRHLERAVKRLGGGDLTAHADVRGSDSIGQLAATFNGMTAHIRRLIHAQREMTRAVSHELRTPVARLRFGLEMLADSESAEARRERLDALDRDIDQLDQLIDEILTYARLEQGTPTIDFQPVYLVEVCEQLRGELDTIRGDIVIEVAGDRTLAVDGDPRYLHRILQNLVTNALRYARARILMTIRLEEGGERVVVEVDDDGSGIPEHQRERVFKPFARLDQSRHRASGGYGLGLSIVKRIVDWHGGEVRVLESDWGGARFQVILPREQQRQHVLGR